MRDIFNDMIIKDMRVKISLIKDMRDIFNDMIIKDITLKFLRYVQTRIYKIKITV